MSMNAHVGNLSDLFYALFRAEPPLEPVIKGRPRMNREEYFALFFPEELCEQYLTKTKSNLTWFFNGDSKNKGIKHALMDAIRLNCRQVVDEVHQKCKNVLWPRGQHPSFDREALYDVLRHVSIRPAINARLHLLETPSGDSPTPLLKVFYRADPSAALARILLTLSVLPDADEEMLSWIWDVRNQDISRSFLARESDVEGQIRYGKLLYLNGEHEQAYLVFERVAKKLNRNAETAEESDMYCRMAEMLLTGDGHYLDQELAVACLRKGLWEGNPESYHRLSQNLEGDEARALLEKAAALGDSSALRELGNAWFGGSQRLHCSQNLENARRCFQQALSIEGADGAYCAYMLGRVCEIRQDADSAISSYRLAREKGSAEAAEKLAQMNWEDPLAQEEATSDADEESHPLRYVLMNGYSGDNRIFAQSLRGPWRWILCAAQEPSEAPRPGVERVLEARRDLAGAMQALSEQLFAPDAPAFPQLTVALLSESAQDNLFQCLAVLQALKKLAIRLGERRWELTDAVSIYVEAEHDYAAMMLDAAFEGMRGLYFRVRVCDPAQDSADQLFSTAPLFLPCLRDPEQKKIRVVVLGTTDLTMALLRRAVSLPLWGEHELSIAVFGEGAERFRQRFLALCPGIASAAPTVFRTVPQFYECDLTGGGLDALLRAHRERQTGQQEDDPQASVLCQANYCVAATEDDEQNIRLGAHLRGALLKQTPRFDHLPFIAAHVRNPVASWLAENLVASPRTRQDNPYGQYGLYCFGAATLYTPARLESDPIERRAQAIHLQYASPADEKSRRFAIASYYTRQYNRDSSRATAQYLIYHLFLAGIALPNWQLYGAPEQEAQLGEAYDRWLSTGEHLEAAAQAEHVRWNCFMLSTGWEQATPLQVSAYVQRGNPGHQLYLARLHPFLCDWQSLKSGALLREVEEAVHSRMPEKRVYDPRQADVDAVKNVTVNLSAGLRPGGTA